MPIEVLTTSTCAQPTQAYKRTRTRGFADRCFAGRSALYRSPESGMP